MIIERKVYLQQVIDAKGNGLIKVITGIRRCGKSFLLSVLFRNHLLESGVSDDQIIFVALDDIRNKPLLDPLKLLDYITGKITDRRQYYVILDEVQMGSDFVGVLNSLLHIPNVDTYVTGSNSRFLSKDVATEFRGRGFDIHLYPLSFAEYYSAVGGDISFALRNYYSFGGLPQLLNIKGETAKLDYLKKLVSTVFIADVVERHRIKNEPEFIELMRIISSSIGAACNPNKLSKTFKNVKNITISHNTIARYLQYLCDAFLIEPAIRYDIKGKKYINTLSKYYFTDMGLRNALLNLRQFEETHIMENVIYNELRMRGFTVDVGIIESFEKDSLGKPIRKLYEVDFVANRGNNRYYIQVAYFIGSEEKMQQETASIKRINDSFKKILIVANNIMPHRNDDGFLIIGLYDFLLKPEVIEQD